VHADVLQYIAPEQFRSAVNVANAKSEPDAIGNAIEGGVDETQWRIGTLQPIPNDKRRTSGLRTFDKAREVGDTELTVTVGVGKVVVLRSGET
jgi:hypothetical protein